MRKLYLICVQIFVIVSLILPSLSHGLLSAYAQTPIPTLPQAQSTQDGLWIPDSDVTFAGKSVARSALFFNWTLVNYQWSYNDPSNALSNFWVKVRNIIYALLLLAVLITAFIIIITGGRSTGALQFVRKFILVVLLITFSFALIRITYQITDIMQGFFLKNTTGQIISSKDLINISFDYDTFQGFRKAGLQYEESAFIGIMLTRLTAITYNTMAGILLARKIILWFFIAVSPVFPLLMLYYPLKNTAKIWIGEFFRWVLYAPLFAIFLSGLVYLWQAHILLLPFHFGSAAGVYPTAINILLGGPGQQLAIDNNLNYNDTYAEYVVALIMLWMVILMPFILLRIFLDYLSSLSLGDNATLPTYLVNKLNRIPGTDWLFGRNQQPSPRPPVSPVTPHSAGVARELPFAAARSQQTYRQIYSGNNVNVGNQFTKSSSRFMTTNSETYRQANLPVPTIRDVAKFEGARLSSSRVENDEILRVHRTLEKIANPSTIQSATEREQYTVLRKKLVEQQGKGDPIASSIMAAAVTSLHMNKGVSGRSSSASGAGSSSGSTTPSGLADQTPQDTTPSSFPVVNNVQTVNLDDYEAVRKTWEENYSSLEPPKGPAGNEQSRKEWIQADKAKIIKAMDLLVMHNPAQTQEGMKMVSHLLPFLLMGGFSQTEVIAYLKAKLKAADTVLSAIDQKDKSEDTLLSAEKKQDTQKEKTASVAEPTNLDNDKTPK